MQVSNLAYRSNSKEGINMMIITIFLAILLIIAFILLGISFKFNWFVVNEIEKLEATHKRQLDIALQIEKENKIE
jgi:hypothetical protein